MNEPKAFEIIKALNNKELREFKNHLSQTGHIKLHIIFEYLLNHTSDTWTEQSKKELFEKVYNESYQEKHDYRLRNLLRNLRKEPENFLIDKEAREDSLQQP